MRNIFSLILLIACSLSVIAQTPNAIQLERVAGGFSTPILVTSARDGSNRLFVLEQSGRIRVLASPTATTSTTLLDVTTKISTGGERGLLGLAFHPDFKNNRRFFINYTRIFDGTTIVAEYKVSSSNPNVAETEEKILLQVDQPFANHNGGMMDFGPDGFLYIGLGDGGSANDPGNLAQNNNELLGKFLRIDVNTTTGNLPYGIPADNPFAGNTPGRDEIYATGLRNPWRWSFDRQTGELYAGDVGQGVREEISIIRRGGNYGWRILEGTRCTGLSGGNCSDVQYSAPLFEYNHTNGRCSITGGYVYRGTRNTFTPGAYILGDYCNGEIMLWQNGQLRTLLDTAFALSSFGEDESGELYLCDYSGGTIQRLVNAPVRMLTNTSAASFASGMLAPNSIVAAFGEALATNIRTATTTPLPTTLLETRVTVRDSTGLEQLASLFFVSAGQINFHLPANVAPGESVITITSGIGSVAQQRVTIAAVAPGIFTANANGRGVPAGSIVRVATNGQRFDPIARLDDTTRQFVPIPIDLGETPEPNALVLYGTGWRGRSALTNVTATIGGTDAPVSFAGAQGELVGLDQVNIAIPFTLKGRGEVNVVLTVDGKPTNPVLINIK